MNMLWRKELGVYEFWRKGRESILQEYPCLDSSSNVTGVLIRRIKLYLPEKGHHHLMMTVLELL